MFCTSCGAKLGDSDLFCPACGAKVPTPEAPPEESLLTPPEFPDTEVDPNPEFPAPESPLPDAPEQPDLFAPEASAPDLNPPLDPVLPEALGTVPADLTPDRFDVPDSFGEAPQQARKKSPLKTVAVALAGLVVLGGLGFGAWKLLSKKSGDNKIVAAAKGSGEALEDYLGQLPNLDKMIKTVDGLEEAAEADLRLKADLNGQTLNIGASVYAEKEAGGMDLSLTIPGATGDITASLYFDKDSFQLASPELLGEGYLLTLNTLDFGKRWNESALGQLTGLEMPEDMSIAYSAADYDPEQMFLSAYGENWTKFADSVQVVKHEGEPHFTQNGDVYTYTWDSQALDLLYQEASKYQTEPGNYNLDPEELLSGGGAKTYAYMLVDVLHQMEEQGAQAQFLIRDKKLLGVFVETEENYFEFLLEGEKNPWEKLRITTGYSYSSVEDKTFEIRDIIDADLSVEGKQLSILVTESHTDSEDHDRYDYQEDPILILYDDATGAISAVDSDGENLMDGLELVLRPEGDKISFSLNHEDTESFTLTLGSMTKKPQPLTGEAHELLDMSEQKLQGLAMKVVLHLQKLLPGTFNMFG